MRHRFASCPCGHSEHIGRALALGVGEWPAATCPACEAIETREGVTLAVETVARVGMLSIGAGSVVKRGDETLRILSLAEITKLNGAIHTGYVQLKLQRMKS